jgi:hypothetical protein
MSQMPTTVTATESDAATTPFYLVLSTNGPATQPPFTFPPGPYTWAFFGSSENFTQANGQNGVLIDQTGLIAQVTPNGTATPSGGPFIMTVSAPGIPTPIATFTISLANPVATNVNANATVTTAQPSGFSPLAAGVLTAPVSSGS